MQLYVRGLDGATTAHLVEGSSVTVLGLQQLLEAAQGIPVQEQLLTSLGGRLLSANAGATLAACGLAHGATLQLLLRLRGGKGGFGALLRGQGRDGKITDNYDACRDLSGRRIRQVEAEKKLKQWEREAKERELEQLALKHMKEMAKQARRERDNQVNVEEVKREHKEAAERVVEAVHTALAEGLHKQHGGGKGSSGKSSSGSSGEGSSGSGSGGAGSAAAAAAGGADSKAGAQGGKRKAEGPAAAAAAGAAAGGGAKGASPPKKRKPTMLDLVEGSDSGSDSDGSDAE